MSRTAWRGWSKLRVAFLFLARPYLGKGDDTDRGSIADGRVPGVQSRSLDACRSTSRMTSPCASAMRPSTRPCSSKVEARCVANWRPVCAPAVCFEGRGPAHVGEAKTLYQPSVRHRML